MLVVFETRAYPPIMMLGEVAVPLLKLMGMSGDIPGAVKAVDVDTALKRLRAGIADIDREHGGGPIEDEQDNEEPPVALSVRAFPLMELLAIASEQGCDVVWTQKKSGSDSN